MEEQKNNQEQLEENVVVSENTEETVAEIPAEEVAIQLINGFHQKPETPVKDGDVVAIFPPVGGG